MRNKIQSLFIKICCLFLLLINSCRFTSREVNFSSFPNELTLKGTPIEINESFKGCIMYNYDSLLILTSIRGSDNQIYIYDARTFKYLATAGKIGRGPGEISSVSYAILDDKNGYIFYQDMARHLIWKFEIDSILKNACYLPKMSIPIPKVVALIYFDVYNDKLFSFLSNKPGKLISFFDNNGNTIDSIDIADKINLYDPSKISFESKNYMAYYFYAINNSKKRIAIVYTRSDVIVFLDMNGNILKRVYGPGKTNQIPNYYDQNQIITTTFIKSDDDFIYCLYKNKLPFDKKTGMFSTYANELNIFNWEGDPLAKLVFDHPVQTFTTSRENNKIITYAPDIDELVEYDFQFDMTKYKDR